MFTRQRFSKSVLQLAAAALLMGGVGSASAGFVISFSQNGANVEANGAGGLNFTALSFSRFDFSSPYMNASTGTLLLGQVPAVYTDVFVGAISGPTGFGSGGLHIATAGTSTAPNNTGAGIDASIGAIFVPGGYAPGEAFSVNSTWANTTLADLGLTAGTYTWTWGSRDAGTADSLTVVIPGTASVPEPSSIALLFIAGLACAGAGRRTKRATA